MQIKCVAAMSTLICMGSALYYCLLTFTQCLLQVQMVKIKSESIHCTSLRRQNESLQINLNSCKTYIEGRIVSNQNGTHLLFLHISVFGAFAKLRKATIRLVMSVCLSDCLSVRTCVCFFFARNISNYTEEIFMKSRKPVDKITVSLKSDGNGGYFT